MLNLARAILGVVVCMGLLCPGTTAVFAQESGQPVEDEPGTEFPAQEFPTNPNPTRRLITPRNDQSPQVQLADEWECYDWACAQTGWDPYEAYEGLVAAGYAVALTRDEMEDGLICLATDGAVTGSVAGEILGDAEKGAEIGAAIAIANVVLRSGYIQHQDDPGARRIISRFERDLRNWDRKFAACLRPKGYGVSSR